MPHQLTVWESEFGKAYTDRNVVDWRTRLRAFRQMLGGLPIRRVLEVGCNRGHNLVALTEFLGEAIEAVGVEFSPYAVALARESTAKRTIRFLRGDAIDLPFRDGCFDLAFTAGVLIHIPPASLPAALAEIYRVTKRYILAIEYFAHEVTPIWYRGQDNLLWKADFLEHYQTQFPPLALIRTGYWGPEDGFDRTHWWLLEKPSGAEEI